MLQNRKELKRKLKERIFKKCFLITPIGEHGSPQRIKLEQWTKLIYEPLVKDKYKLIASYLIATPGVITKQIIDNIIDADLVIIDYTPDGNFNIPNPNVMYEAAIRHISKKPFIQIAPIGLRIPFDIHVFRCSLYNPTDLEYPQKLLKELKSALKSIDLPEYKVPDIIGHTFDLDRIVSDPEKFIQILKDKLFSNENKKISFENVINYGSGPTATTSPSGPNPSYSPSYSLSPSASLSRSSRRLRSLSHISDLDSVQCPNCSFEFEIAPTSFIGVSSQQYQCPSCGTLFKLY